MNFEMQVGPARIARATHIADGFTDRYIAASTFPRVEMGVVEPVSIGGGQPHRISAGVAALELCKATERGHDRGPTVSCHVDAEMLPSARTRRSPTVDELALT